MNSKITFAILLAIIVLFSGCLTSNQNDGYNNDTSEQAITIENKPTQAEPVESAKINEPINEIDPLKAQIDKMTLNEKIGQMLLVGSVNAGSDIILVCHGYDNQVNALKAIKTAVEDGTIPEYRVDESVYRIMKLKNKYKLTDEPTTSINIDEINKKIDAVLGKWYN